MFLIAVWALSPRRLPWGLPWGGLAGVAAQQQAKNTRYTTRFDSIDVEVILKNERIFRRYMDCLLDKGRCTPEARELKRLLPEALKTECLKCSEVQRRQGAKVMAFIIKNKRPSWELLLAKYDPQGIFRAKYMYNENNIEAVLKQLEREQQGIYGTYSSTNSTTSSNSTSIR
uniref:Chemosensory protein 4 n=1 Tax=Nilaparvata lugens TaxID=108931 RepID=B7TVH1_NILLU|nr:putative chemosensory protein CSP4 [Nilaparvata lugens]ASL05047.1 chemosensory protein 4 [Nilaparvata lugens]